MSWLVFSYSLTSKSHSSNRVALWRRLKRLGALPHASGVYVLPDREECAEAFEWLSQEVQQSKGNASFMRVEKFEGTSDNEIVASFHELRKKDYEAINSAITKLEKLASKKDSEPQRLKANLEKVRNEFTEIARIDFFGSPLAKKIQSRLGQFEEKLAGPKLKSEGLPSYKTNDYQHKKWVTRPRPHVDRLGSAWLIRRFVDKNAAIRYSHTPLPEEIPFDTKGALFGHHGNFCTFETIMAVFHLKDAALQPIAEVIHEIDLRDARYFRPEAEGVAAILKGWMLAGFSDAALESHGMALFEGLYAAFSKTNAK